MFQLKRALKAFNQERAEFINYLGSISDKDIEGLHNRICEKLDAIRDYEKGLKSKPFFLKSYDKEMLQGMDGYVLEEIRSRNFVYLQKIKGYLDEATAIVEVGIVKKDLPYLDGMDLSVALSKALECADECKWNVWNLFRCEKEVAK